MITTPFSFVSSANCILMEDATPVFVDIEPRILNIDPDKIEKRITDRTKATLAVDVFGHPAEWDDLKHIARQHRLRLIEDSAEVLGAEWRSPESRVQSPESQLQSQGSRVVSRRSQIKALRRNLNGRKPVHSAMPRSLPFIPTSRSPRAKGE